MKAPPKPAKRGRPISSDGAKDSHLLVRLAWAEKQVIEAAAEQAGVSVSAWVRETLLAAALNQQSR